jgi:Family of unknown function (DUF6192)
MGDLLHFPLRAVHLQPTTVRETPSLQDPDAGLDLLATATVGALKADWVKSRRRSGEIRPLTARTQGQVLDVFVVYMPRHATKIRQRHIEDWLESMGDLALEVAPMGSKGVDSGAIEKIERFGEEISVEAQTLRDYRRVAAAWPNAERSAFASWSVHQILASKPDRFDLIKRLPVDKKTKIWARKTATA